MLYILFTTSNLPRTEHAIGDNFAYNLIIRLTRTTVDDMYVDFFEIKTRSFVFRIRSPPLSKLVGRKEIRLLRVKLRKNLHICTYYEHVLLIYIPTTVWNVDRKFVLTSHGCSDSAFDGVSVWSYKSSTADSRRELKRAC